MELDGQNGTDCYPKEKLAEAPGSKELVDWESTSIGENVTGQNLYW